MIQHYDELVSRFSGVQKEGRKILFSMMESALTSVSPEALIRNAIRYEKDTNTLWIQDHRFRLSNPPKVAIIGGGKATGRMAVEVEKRLGKIIQEGIIVIPRSQNQQIKTQLDRIEVAVSDHPIPSQEGVESVKRLLALVDSITNDTFVVCLISGGGSALLPAPAEGISLSDLQEMNKLLLASGATIHEINAIRKHLSQIKGGYLAARLVPRSWASLIISDVVGDDLDVIASGPTVADSSTFNDVKQILMKYHLMERIPEMVSNRIEAGVAGRVPETIKDPQIFAKGKNIIIGSIRDACEAARQTAENTGVSSQIISTTLIGEAVHVGRELAKTFELLNEKRPFAAIYGGETTVTLHGKGQGGRNQELVVSAARYLKHPRNFIGSIATDGIDGNAPAAGGLIDWTTISRARLQKLDIEKFLAQNDSYNFLRTLGDVLETGPTGTNVMDMQILLAL